MIKKIFILFMICVTAPLLFAQTVVFEQATLIETSTGLSGNARPRIVIDEQGTTHLIWATGVFNNSQIRYARAVQNEAFGSNVIIDDIANYYSDGGEGATLRVYGEFVAVGYEDFVSMSNNGVWVRKSSNSGMSWDDPIQANPSATNHVEIQCAALFPDGRLAQSWLDISGTPEVAWSKQNNEGQFSEPELITGVTTNPVCECCYPDHIVLDDGQTLLVSYRNNLENIREIYVMRSTDGGETFSSNTRVDETHWEINGCPASGGNLSADGQNVLITWMSGAEGSSRIWSARSSNGGETWEPMVELDSDGVNYVRNYPQAVVRGNIAAVVWQGADEHGDWHIYCCVSADNGATWGDAIPVSYMEFIIQSQPTVAISPNNSIEIVWKDRRSGSPQLYRAIGTIDEGSGILDNPLPLPSEFNLNIYPNPFNPSTNISFELSTLSHVQLDIYDVQGRVVANLISGEMNAGSHEVQFDGTNLGAGVYFARLQAGNQIMTEKLLLLK